MNSKTKLPLSILGYWKYYDDRYDWNGSDEPFSFRPDLNESRDKLQEGGLSEAEADRYVRSGFVYEPFSELIIDRYYGGLLRSSDSRTRFFLEDFCKREWEAGNHVQVRSANSWSDVQRIVDDWRSTCRKRLLFRGQPENYPVSREVHNPFFLVDGVGEISLIPSLWRRMLARNPNGFVWFENLLSLEWRKILDSVFDLEEIERRKKAIAGENLAFYNWFDFEKCGDQMLEGCAECYLDLMMGERFNLAGLLSTLLQHYGLYSPMLDLTESLDVAIFFASHQFHRTGSECSYEFVGTNSQKSIIYVFREDREMQEYERNERIIQKLNPLRPIQQQCVVCTSSPYAINLPSDFLRGVILLEFDSPMRGSTATVDDLFPTDTQDAFLRGLKENPFAKLHVTDFAPFN